MRACAAVAALLVLGTHAHAQSRWSLSSELSVGAGYDDNLFLDPTLTTAAPPRADAIIDVRPSLVGALVHRGHALLLSADYLERITPGSGDIRYLLLRPEWRSPRWHGLRLSLAAFYEHYEATRFSDNTFDLGGAELALRWILPAAWLQAAYRVDARGYADPSRNGQIDVSHQAAATAHVRLHATLALELGYRFLDISSNEPTAATQRHRGEVGFDWQPAVWLSARLAYSTWWQVLPEGGPPLPGSRPGGARHDWAHAIGATVSVHPRRWLELFARYDFIFSTSDEDNGRYRLDQVVGGAALSWTFTHEQIPPPPPLFPEVHGHEVTFRARARPGAQVGVVGDWNDWQPQPLAAGGGDRYQGTYTLPPGRHAWALNVDGALVTPPEASAFVDDGYGGKNAIVEVR